MVKSVNLTAVAVQDYPIGDSDNSDHDESMTGDVKRTTMSTDPSKVALEGVTIAG